MTKSDDVLAPDGAVRSIGPRVRALGELPASRRDYAAATDMAGQRGARIAKIIARTAQRHGVSVDDLLGKRRFRHLVKARYEAIRLVAEIFPSLSTTRLGEIFGDRDHTSILWALGSTADSPYSPIVGREDRKPGRARKLKGCGDGVVGE